MNIKTLANWPEGMSVGQYLRVGDIVDEDLYMHFLNVLPPQAFEHGFLQVGGACDTIEDVDGKLRNTYLTFTKGRDHDGWVFMGECFNREWINRNPTLEPKRESDVDLLIADAAQRGGACGSVGKPDMEMDKA